MLLPVVDCRIPGPAVRAPQNLKTVEIESKASDFDPEHSNFMEGDP